MRSRFWVSLLIWEPWLLEEAAERGEHETSEKISIDPSFQIFAKGLKAHRKLLILYSREKFWSMMYFFVFLWITSRIFAKFEHGQ